MIGLIAAEKDETGNLVKSIKAKIIEFNGVRYYIGDLNGKQVVVCFSGIGKTNAALTAMNMVINFGVTQIFNIGLCGSCKTNVKPGSVIIANNIEYYDIDLTAFNYQLNQLPDEPTSFEIKKEYVDFLKTTTKESTVGTIASGDSVVGISNIEGFPSLGKKEVIGFDMEAAAIAHVCHKTKIDFMCVKLVSDNITFDSNSRSQYDTNYKTLAKRIESISLKVLEYYSK
ncbi:MAG: 5'-methylthioadenosine/S-adenosylhomocysteine nucleosidase [Mycoplasmoidaceae bacterium]|nr:5'-methylthioadenosine/S-adenosylhomocysteine nucleosidase [Mycoplasmoidaceae bacterium]